MKTARQSKGGTIIGLRRSTRSRSWLLRSGGFTLLEVLVGIAILGMAAVVLGAAYVNTMSAHDAVARRAAGGHELDFLREAVWNEPEREKVEEGGRLNLPDGRQLEWMAQIEEAPVPDLFRVDLRGRIVGGPGEPVEFTQRVMLLRPTWSDVGKREQLATDWAREREEARR